MKSQDLKRPKQCMNFDDEHGSSLDSKYSDVALLDPNSPEEIRNPHENSQSFTMFDRIKQRFSFCCCVKSKDSQTKLAQPRSFSILKSIQSKQKIHKKNNTNESKARISEKSTDLKARCINTSDSSFKQKSSCAINQRTKGGVHKNVNHKTERSKQFCSKYIYELSQEGVKSLQEKGCIKLNVKMKPGISVTDFSIIIQKDKIPAMEN